MHARLLLGVFGVVFAACTNGAAPPAASPASKLTIVPQGMVGVALVGAEAAPFETISADALLAKKKEVQAEAIAMGASAERSPGLFFYAFDRTRVVYFYGRTHWRCSGLGCWDYVAEKQYVVLRDGHAESKLGVGGTIDLYESAAPVRGGMSFEEVKAVLGPPRRVEPLQYVGSERWYYADRTILFLGMRVAAIEAPRP